MKNISRILIVLVLLMLGVRLEHTTAQETPEYWPTEGWRTSTPEEQGMDAEQLAGAVDYLLGQDDYDVHSLLIIRNGLIVTDAYFYPYTPETRHDWASVTKSFTSTLVGIAIQQGYITDVQQPVLSFFANRTIANIDANKEAMTIENLLTMQSGLACVTDPAEVTLLTMVSSPNWVQFTLDLPMDAAPGKRWVYCSPGPHLLQGIIAQASQMNTADFARKYLFEPLGINDALWPTDPQQIVRGWGDLRLTPYDVAKLGYLYLQNGVWENEQILPDDWVAAATAPASDLVDYYGYLWWLEKDYYAAQGRGGQRLIVVPEQNLIVVVTGNGGSDIDQTVDTLLHTYILPAIQSAGPLPDQPDSVAMLEDRIQQAAEAPPATPEPVPPLPDIAQEISGQTYLLDPNLLGFTAFSLTFGQQDVALAQVSMAGSGPYASFQWTIGLDHVARVSPGRYDIPAATSGAWVSDDTFVIQVDEIGNNLRYDLTLTFDEDQVSVEMSDHSDILSEPITIGGRQQ